MHYNTKQPNGSTPQRLRWVNPHVAALAGKRDPDGGRVLQPRDMTLLAFLEAFYPGLEATITREQVMEWLECAESTPREILCRLRRLRLIEYEPLGGGEARVASRLADQPALPLSESPGDSGNQQVIPGRVSTESPSDSGNQQVILDPPPPHPHPGSGASGMYTTPHDTARAPAREPSASEGSPIGSSAGPSESLELGAVRQRRLQMLGVARLPGPEYVLFQALRQVGGTIEDVTDGEAEFELRLRQRRAFRSAGSFKLVLELALETAAARRQHVTEPPEGASPPERRESNPAAEVRGASPRALSGRGKPARRLTMDEEVARLLADWETKYASRNGDGGGEGPHPAEEGGPRRGAG